MSEAFERRMTDALPAAAERFGTPFYLYDREGIDEQAAGFAAALAALGADHGIRAREFFAVKALPNPEILKLLVPHGFGFDCSSLPELELASRAGAAPGDLFFTSSNTSAAELVAAAGAGARITIDDESVLDRLAEAGIRADALTLRVNPGPLAPAFDASLFGDPAEAKFGIPTPRVRAAADRMLRSGVRRIGLHMMVAANTRAAEPVLFALDHLLDVAEDIAASLGVEVDVVNLGGGFGVPYRPGEAPLDVAALFAAIGERASRFAALGHPLLCFENGRYLTAPHGVLVASVVNRMSKWRELLGVDANVTAMLRAAIYDGVHHHVSAPLAEGRPTEIVDVVGSLCTNADRLAIDRELPVLAPGDLVVVHDLGAHGHAMGSTYNARLRPQELLLDGDRMRLIRRAETPEDYFATLNIGGGAELEVAPASRAGAR